MTTKIHWAPRVPMAWLHDLYERDAAGTVDDELIEKVGYRLYQRCRDCIDVARGHIRCGACGSDTLATEGVASCSACTWTCEVDQWRRSWRHKEIFAEGARHIFEEFIASWDRAREPRSKMLAIDRVIHQWHWANRDEKPGVIGRPTGVNLIEGSRKQVIEFLDRLSSGPIHDAWATKRDEVDRRTRAAR